MFFKADLLKQARIGPTDYRGKSREKRPFTLAVFKNMIEIYHADVIFFGIKI